MVLQERRTQKERRESTVRKLLDAATEALIELGYGGATVQEISSRAGVSQGGLFRHFPTREALMVAAGEDVGRKLLESYRAAFEKPAKKDPMMLALVLVRESCRSRLNQAWYELAIAARTNPALEKALAPAAKQYYADIEALAAQLLPDVAEKLGPMFPVLVETITAIFDGEAVHRFILDNPKGDKARMDLLAKLLEPIARR